MIEVKTSSTTRTNLAPRKCKHCGTEFIPDVVQRVYCSDRCVKDARNKRRRRAHEVQCAVCGRMFISGVTGRRKYCSEKCFRVADKKRIRYQCRTEALARNGEIRPLCPDLPQELLAPAPPPPPPPPPKPEWRPWILEGRQPTKAEMDAMLDKVFA